MNENTYNERYDYVTYGEARDMGINAAFKSINNRLKRMEMEASDLSDELEIRSLSNLFKAYASLYGELFEACNEDLQHMRDQRDRARERYEDLLSELEDVLAGHGRGC